MTRRSRAESRVADSCIGNIEVGHRLALPTADMRWIMGPGIAALVGAFVGFAARVRGWQLAVLAAMPYAFLFSGSWSSSSAVLFSVLYVGLAGFAAWVVSKSSRGQTLLATIPQGPHPRR